MIPLQHAPATIPFVFREFGGDSQAASCGARQLAEQDNQLDFQIELGRAVLSLDELSRLKADSLLPLDKLAADPVDILVDGRLLARGEVILLNGNISVRVAEIVSPLQFATQPVAGDSRE